VTQRAVGSVTADVDAVVAELRASRKYRYVAAAALARTAAAALRGARGRADAVKRAKRKLHQLFAAFVTPAEIERAQRIVGSLPANEGADALRAACREILKRHSSTRERTEPDAAWYAWIWKVTGPPRVVLDLGCGFHPFALPWMGLPAACEYLACDVDERIAALVGRLLEHCGRRGGAIATDLLASDAPIDTSADVVFVMKLLPTLERQEEGAAGRLLERLRARFLVVTFPAKSLSGRERGMAANYEAFLRDLLDRNGERRFDRAVRIEGDEPAWIIPA
jgi:16S rRNA (guanine(1405)-N(7))-methyltransferase